ncbi:MAG: 4'-phosphopantetheinyl transferase superfamily protein [Bacilli bacterium]|nr:4'-phosphopantetheinyl transferase superfamily protein [Bacilli bacterium]
MIKQTIGVDLVDHARFIPFLEDYRKLKRILSLQEIEVLQTFTHDGRKLEFVASRFAVKEALIKAGLTFDYAEVSILNHENGAPYVVGPFQESIQVTLSHTHTTSVAFVIVRIEIAEANE